MNKTTIVASLVLGGMIPTAHSATIYVDIANCPGPGTGTIGDPYCSIQLAIVNVMTGDEIVVAPGTYTESINFSTQSITVRSAAGPQVTTIESPSRTSPVVTIAWDSSADQGQSMQLQNPSLDNNDGSNWNSASTRGGLRARLGHRCVSAVLSETSDDDGMMSDVPNLTDAVQVRLLAGSCARRVNYGVFGTSSMSTSILTPIQFRGPNTERSLTVSVNTTFRGSCSGSSSTF